MTTHDWAAGYLGQRRWSARRPPTPEQREALRRRREWTREMMRVALAASLIILGVLVVEMGRKATSIVHLAEAPSLATAAVSRA